MAAGLAAGPRAGVDAAMFLDGACLAGLCSNLMKSTVTIVAMMHVSITADVVKPHDDGLSAFSPVS